MPISDAVWYYADGDVERGPISEAQMRMLIGTGNLTPEDLVWRDGMEDWAHAGEVGLFESSPKDKDKEKGKGKSSKVPDPLKSRKSTKPLVKTDPPHTLPPAKMGTSKPFRGVTTVDLSQPLEVFRPFAFLSQPLLLGGLLLMLLARGCDSVSEHQTARLNAKAELAENIFADQWEREKAELAHRRQELMDKPEPTGADQSTLELIKEEEKQLDKQKTTEQVRLKASTWRELKAAARNSQHSQQMWSFWRELAYWLGCLVLVLGLLSVGFTAKGPERWIGLALLSIVVYGLLMAT